MAFLAPVAWEVRTTGSTSNGGGFDPTSGTPGTDFSQQDAAQIAYTDMVIGVTTTTFTSVANPPAASLVGNIINVTGGSGFSVQRVQVISVAAGVATCDKSLGTTGSTGGIGNMGGALLLIQTASGLYVAGNTIWIKSGTYTSTTARAFSVAGTAAAPVLVQGYQTTRGDLTGTQPIITSATNSVSLFTLSTCNFSHFKNLKFTHTAATRGAGIQGTGGDSSNVRFSYLIFDGCLNGIDDSSRQFSPVGVLKVSILNSTGVGWVSGASNVSGSINDSLFYNNASDGYRNSLSINTLLFRRCIFSKNGANGIYMSGTIRSNFYTVLNCTFEGNTGAGIRDDVTSGIPTLSFLSNVFYANGTYGINFPNLATAASYLLVIGWSAFGSNTSGNLNNITAGPGDITGISDPFTARGTGLDWSLNNTAGAGALLRAASDPGAFAGSNTIGYLDIGAVQHQDSGGSSVFAVDVQNTVILNRFGVAGY